MTLNCPNCGAPLDSTMSGNTYKCKYCHQTITLEQIEAPKPNYPTGSQVPAPIGFKRASYKDLTKEMIAFAVESLKHCMPIGKRQELTIDDKPIIAQTEWHYDNHPNHGQGTSFWHPGISIYIWDDSIYQ